MDAEKHPPIFLWISWIEQKDSGERSEGRKREPLASINLRKTHGSLEQQSDTKQRKQENFKLNILISPFKEADIKIILKKLPTILGKPEVVSLKFQKHHFLL